MNRIELLAPARDLACGVAALDCGADAVYVGAPEFGARKAAGVPVADIARLAARAHRYWARVYPALNTILTDEELPRARRLMWELADAGADGFIIQDPGLLELDLPPVPLIASTQMHNDSPERVRFLERVGFRRAILARELSLAEIRRVREATSIELECFVHGALCVSASGRCWLSWALGGRSGNRGECAQPCRRPYALVDEDGRPVSGAGRRGGTGRRLAHPLSIKDLDLSGHLGPLLDAGITSFKIEGRLKDEAYVRNVVGRYRRLLDAILPRKGLRPASSGATSLGFEPDTARTFNRGRTSYRLSGSLDAVGWHDTPKSMGEPIGEVAAAERGSFTLKKGALQAGDGLCWLDQEGLLQGTAVRRVEGRRVFPESMAGLRAGVEVWRNLDRAFLDGLKRARPSRAIRVNLELTARPGSLDLRAVDEDGVAARASVPAEHAPAKDAAAAGESCRRRLAKLGGTEFLCEGLVLGWDSPRFAPASKLNELRRRLVADLAAAREEARPRESVPIAPNAEPFPETELDYQANVLNAKARAFYLRHGARVREPAAETGLRAEGRTLMTTRLCLAASCGLCPRETGGRLRPLFLVDGDRRRFRLEFDCEACRMRVVG